jgi:hypothetical protein
VRIKKLFIAGGLVSIIMVLTLAMSSVFVGAQTPTPTPAVTPGAQVSIAVQDQIMMDDTVVIDRIVLDRAGWIDLHPVDAQGQPISAIGLGYQYLGPGTHTNIGVRVAATIHGNIRVAAMLHYDSPADRVFNFKLTNTEDRPAMVNNQAVVDIFELRVGTETPVATPTLTPTVSPAR